MLICGGGGGEYGSWKMAINDKEERRIQESALRRKAVGGAPGVP